MTERLDAPRPLRQAAQVNARWLLITMVWALSCAEPQDIEPGTGNSGEPCYPNATCNAPFVCAAGVCVEGADAGLDAPAGGAGGSGGGGGTSGGSGASSGGSGGSSATGGTGGGVGGSSGGVGGSSGGAGGGSGGVGGSSGGMGGAAGAGGSVGAPPAPTGAQGCTTCDCCDPWVISWSPVTEATYYNVRWKCSIFPENVKNVGLVTQVDLCSATVGMCSTAQCANSVGFVQVQACNASACSAPVAIPASGMPLACGGGCCC
ncbi:MAG: hypothetical protein KF718_19995 [Polyangiaceae bacterium]|nr:hypothetical protein [Polyangiaceae bacterium]